MEKRTKRPESMQILFYFSALRGRGKSSAVISKVELTQFPILFIFLEPQNKAATCVLQNVPRMFICRYTNQNERNEKNEHV